MKDILSADSSPQRLKTAGVRRVNNLPLVIVIGILTLFLVLIAFVAHKRAAAQNEAPAIVKIAGPKKNIMNLASEMVGNYKEAVVPNLNEAIVTVDEPVQVKLPQKQVLNFQDDAEIERIRQVKSQEFEEAVKAKTSIQLDNSHLSKENTSPSLANSNDASYLKEQLQLLQGKPMPQTLGGEEYEIRWHLNSSLESPDSAFELRTGGIIPGVMVGGISSELPGQIIGQVSQNVYDSATGKYLLIPQGTKLIGLYSSDVGFGQNSVLVAWQRLIFPDGKALDIGSMPGADGAGFAGFRDKVNHHYVRIYGSAFLMSAIVAGISYSQNDNQSNQFGYREPSAGSVLSQALGQQLGEVTSQLIAKNLNIAPTINIRQGYRFNIIVVKDLTFNQPYQAFAY